MKLTDLVAATPWREVVNYRDTWPHEYALTEMGDYRELLEAIRAGFRAVEGASGRFFRMNNAHLFIGDHKHWLTIHSDELEARGDYVINRARLYRHHRDFAIQLGNTGRPEHYPANPPHNYNAS